MNCTDKIAKPKLVFFRWKDESVPKFLLLQVQQHIQCLSEFFEVIAISEDCDYQQICDKYQPDITLFESGIGGGLRHRPKIKNTSAYPDIPKLGLYNGDAFCACRSFFLSDMEQWGIQTFFSISISLAEYMPEIASNLFIWPNFIDADIYRDYGGAKIIPALFTGNYSSLYPWRQRISKIVSQYYPSLICPHGYYGKQLTSRIIYGEQYARLINSSWIVPACGTIANEIIRKHFEIPGSKSCLITEQTPAIEACGFIDMQNCVFADETDVLDKLDYLFQHPDDLERITNAGYQLVHSRHTLKQRDQILQWFNLYKALKPNQRIVQTSPFEPLTIVEELSGIKNSHIIGNGLDRVLLRKGDEKLWAGKYDEAEVFYLSCLNYVSYLPEPKLRLTLCDLYKGNAAAALDWIVQPIQFTLESHKASEPDPVEWAYFIISLLCQGKLNDAIKRANQFPSLCHPELDRTRWVTNVLKNRGDEDNLLHSDLSKCRYSVHQLPNRSFNDWVDNLCIMLKACQQLHLAETLSKSVSSEYQLLNKQNISDINQKFLMKFQEFVYNSWLKDLAKIFKKLPTSKSIVGLPLISEPNYIKLGRWVKSKSRKIFLNPLNHLETRFGYFLPYRFSEIKNDEFFRVIQKLTREEDIKTALVIGASAGEGSTKAFLRGIWENPNKPTVFCMNISTPQFVKLQKRYANESFVRCYTVPSVSLKKFPNETENVIKKIKQENKINFFDVVLIDKFEFTISAELDEVHGARFVLLDDINTFQNYKKHHRLLVDKNYTLVTHNPSLRDGYAIFKKVNRC